MSKEINNISCLGFIVVGVTTAPDVGEPGHVVCGASGPDAVNEI